MSPKPRPEARYNPVTAATAAHTSAHSYLAPMTANDFFCSWSVCHMCQPFLPHGRLNVVQQGPTSKSADAGHTQHKAGITVYFSPLVIADSAMPLQLRGSCAVASATMPGGSKWPAAPGRLTAGLAPSWP